MQSASFRRVILDTMHSKYIIGFAKQRIAKVKLLLCIFLKMNFFTFISFVLQRRRVLTFFFSSHILWAFWANFFLLIF